MYKYIKDNTLNNNFLLIVTNTFIIPVNVALCHRTHNAHPKCPLKVPTQSAHPQCTPTVHTHSDHPQCPLTVHTHNDNDNDNE